MSIHQEQLQARIETAVDDTDLEEVFTEPHLLDVTDHSVKTTDDLH